MNTVDRRHFCSVVALAGLAASTKTLIAQTGAPAVPASGSGTLGAARVIALDKLDERKTATGASWSVAHGTLATGEGVGLHASMQAVGAPAVQLHTIQHSEFIVVLDGEVEFKHEVEGQVATERATSGDVIYIAFGTKHAV